MGALLMGAVLLLAGHVIRGPEPACRLWRRGQRRGIWRGGQGDARDGRRRKYLHAHVHGNIAQRAGVYRGERDQFGWTSRTG